MENEEDNATLFLRERLSEDNADIIGSFIQTPDEQGFCFDPSIAPLPEEISFQCPILVAAVFYKARKCYDVLLQNVNQSKSDLWGTSAIHMACRYDEIDFLKNKNLKPDFGLVDWKNQTPLHYAAKYNSKNCAAFLIESGVDVNAVDRFGITPLYLACENGNLEMARFLLSHGADVRSDVYGKTPAVAAVSHNKVQVLSALPPELIKQTDKDGRSLLHIAAINGASDVISPLVQFGLDINLKDSLGMAPLHYASENNFGETISAILSVQNTDRDVRDNFGQTALQIAAEFNSLQALKVILEKCPESGDKTDNAGKTALHSASSAGHVEAVQLLVESGLSSDVKDQQMLTPSDMAYGAYSEMICSALKKQNVDLSNLRAPGEPGYKGEKKKVDEAPAVKVPPPEENNDEGSFCMVQ